MANNILAQAQQLKLLIEQARQHFDASHNSVIEILRSQFEKEKNEASCPPLGFVCPCVFLLVCRWPQSLEGDYARPRLCKLAQNGP